MATTVSARRCAELIARYRGNKNSKEPSFTTQFNAVFHLLGRLRLSRHNCILCGKFINEMADTWIDRDQLEMIESLRERQARSWDRWKKRIEERKAEKAAGPTKKHKPTPAPIVPTHDPWATHRRRQRGEEILGRLQLIPNHHRDDRQRVRRST